jgi:NAD(P)-dependent dehydrogenase (short-subunit alcohol dehydrogenase family)
MNGAPIARLATVEEISAYVLFPASEEAAFSTGTELIADGGYLLM